MQLHKSLRLNDVERLRWDKHLQVRLRDEEIMQDRHRWATDSIELVVIFLNSDPKLKIIFLLNMAAEAQVWMRWTVFCITKAQSRGVRFKRLILKDRCRSVKSKCCQNLTGEMDKINIYLWFIKLKSLCNVMCTCFSATIVWAFESTLKNPPSSHTRTHIYTEERYIYSWATRCWEKSFSCGLLGTHRGREHVGVY